MLAAVLLGVVGGAYAQRTPDFVPNQVIVKFRPESAGGAPAIHAALGARVTKTLPQIGAQTVTLPAGYTVSEALTYYRSLGAVEYAHPNFIVRPLATVNDPRYNLQWWLPKVGATSAWDLSIGASGIKIAVIDTGVDYNHEDLRGKVILGRDTINNDNDPMDRDGHGTHVAGIAAAATNNGIGVAGLGYNCQVIAIKVLDPSGTLQSVADGIINAVDLGAQVINLSLGAYGTGKVQDDALAYAASKNVVIIAAAGNDNTSQKMYPGANPLCIAVGATEENDRKAGFSNFGGDWVDVAAPGQTIFSTMPGNRYAYLQGTSMASPVVAGLAGLMRAYSPTTTAAEIRRAIENTTVPVGPWVARGRISAPNALRAVLVPLDVPVSVEDVRIFQEGSLVQGLNQTGTKSDLRFLDSNPLGLDSVYVNRNGWMAGVEMVMPFEHAASRWMGGQYVIRHRSTSRATTTVFLYNHDRQRWDAVRSLPGSAGATTVRFDLPRAITPYLRNGAFRSVVRSYVPARTAAGSTGYRFELDHVGIAAKVRPLQ